MADKNDKVSENVGGSYYVDQQCIACGLCPDEAPDNFKMSDDESHAFVYKQPDTESEKNESKNALEACPVDAIGDDGE
jgi:ferredoxin